MRLLSKKGKLNFVMMIGISGAGKTQIAKDIQKELNKKEETVILSSDQIRKELNITKYDKENTKKVFSVLEEKAIEYLKQNVNVIYDATNLISKNRIKLLKKIQQSNIECCKTGYIVNVSKSEAFSHSYVTRKVINQQIKSFQIPMYFEGFDNIEIHGNQVYKKINSLLYSKIKKLSQRRFLKYYYMLDKVIGELDGFNQYNKKQDFTLSDHCRRTWHELIMKKDEQKYLPLMTSGALHDYGKYYCFNLGEDGQFHYSSHSNVGAYMILGFYKKFYEYMNWEEFLQMVWLVNNHMFFECNSQNEEQKRNKESLWGSELYQNLLSLHEANKKCQRRG